VAKSAADNAAAAATTKNKLRNFIAPSPRRVRSFYLKPAEGRSKTVTAACGTDETADVNHHHPDPCRAADHHCHDEVDHYRDAADHCCQNHGAAVHCYRYPDAAADRRSHDAVDDPHSAADCCRNPCAAVQRRDAAACRRNRDAAADPRSAACSFQSRASADDPPSAAYSQNPDAAAHHRHPVALADGDRSAACCSAASRPVPYCQNPDAADDRQTA
jgi:hypothetical protein